MNYTTETGVPTPTELEREAAKKAAAHRNNLLAIHSAAQFMTSTEQDAQDEIDAKEQEN